MNAISRSLRTNPLSNVRYTGAPLLSTPLVSLQTKYKYHRMRDLLRNALSGANGRDLFATPATQMAAAGGLPSAGLFSGDPLGSAGLGLGSDGFDLGPLPGIASRRGSMAPTRAMVPGGGGPASAGSRKPSISSAAGM